MAYAKQKKITINSAKIDSTLTDYPVAVRLNTTNFDFSSVRTDRTDIAFYDNNDTLLAFEKEYDSNVFLNCDSTAPDPWALASVGAFTFTQLTSEYQFYAPSGAGISLANKSFRMATTDNVKVIVNVRVSDDNANSSRGGMISIEDGVRWVNIYCRNTTIAYWNGSSLVTFATGLTLTTKQKVTVEKNGTTNVVIKVNDVTVGTIPYTSLATTTLKNLGFGAQQTTTAIFSDYEFINVSTPSLVYHVKVPSVSSSVDTTFKLKYSDPTMVTSLENKTGVWTNGYAMVHHLGNSLKDSTSNAKHGTNVNTTVTATDVGEFRNFTVGQHITFPSSTNITNGTFQIMLKTTDNQWLPLTVSPYNSNYYLMANSSTASFYHNLCGSPITTYTNNVIDVRGFYNNTWQLLTATGVDFSGWSGFSINEYGEPWGLAGQYHEFRLSTVVRSNAWIKADDSNLRVNDLITLTDVFTFDKARIITIDSSKVDATLTNYPVMVKLTNSNFNFDGVRSDGLDFTFSDMSDVELPYEREYFVSKTIDPIYSLGNNYAYGVWSATGYVNTSYASLQQPIINAQDIQVRGTWSGSIGACLAGTANVVDVTNFKYLHMKVNILTAPNGVQTYASFGLSRAKNPYSDTNLVTFKSLSSGVTGLQTLTLDVSAITGNCYIFAVGDCHANGYVVDYKITSTWLSNSITPTFPFANEPIGIFHVKVPSVSSSVDTVFKMKYGNALVSSDISNKTAVWDANFVMVQHMGTSLLDSTRNGNNGTNVGTTVVSGLHGEGRNFSGSSQSIILNNNSIPTGSQFTFSALTYQNTAAYNSCLIEAKASASTVDRTLNLHIPWGDYSVYFDSGSSTSVYDRVNTTLNSTYFNGRWDIWTASKNSTTGIMQLLNNTTTVASGVGKTATNQASTCAYLGAGMADGSTAGNTNYWKGIMSEVRMSNIVRSDAWIKADDYGLRLNTLLTVGTEVGLSKGIKAVNVGGAWKEVSDVKVNIGGTWKDVLSIYTNINGTWKQGI